MNVLLSEVVLFLAIGSPVDPPKTHAWVNQPSIIPVVNCVSQSEPLASAGDAADDAAVWVHPTDPAQSIIIGTNKQVGLVVFDLMGKTLQLLADGRMNNVDVVQGVEKGVGTKPMDLVFSSNRSSNTVTAYRVDPASRTLERLGIGLPTGLDEVYGLCAYVDQQSKMARVVVGSKMGTVKTFEVSVDGEVARGKLIREFVIGTQVEGMVADTTYGSLYVGEEQVGVWRYPLDPASEEPRRLLDVVKNSTGVSGNLAPDVEGVTLYAAKDGTGWIIVSCQGEDRYAAYDRKSGAYAGSFRLMFGKDPVTHTDGIAALSTPMGKEFPEGIFVTQDDNDGASQNFKMVSWAAIDKALRSAIAK